MESFSFWIKIHFLSLQSFVSLIQVCAPLYCTEGVDWNSLLVAVPVRVVTRSISQCSCGCIVWPEIPGHRRPALKHLRISSYFRSILTRYIVWRDPFLDVQARQPCGQMHQTSLRSFMWLLPFLNDSGHVIQQGLSAFGLCMCHGCWSNGLCAHTQTQPLTHAHKYKGERSHTLEEDVGKGGESGSPCLW